MGMQTKHLLLLAACSFGLILLLYNHTRTRTEHTSSSNLLIRAHMSSCPASCRNISDAAVAPKRSDQTYRVAPAMQARYVQQDKSIPWASVGGPGMHFLPGLTVAMISKHQRAWAITGAVGEIGVHHGAFFLSLLVTARKNERIWALDIFSQQDKNVDKSGSGDLAAFVGNIEALGVRRESVTITEGSSTEFSVAQLCSDVPQPFRLMSIDGGHTSSIVYSDMHFAECHLAEGGVVIMDDYTHPYWVGVHEGVIQYLHEYRNTTRLAPFFLGANKLYLTTKSHHQRFLDAMTAESFWDKGCNTKPFCIEAPGKNDGTLAKFQLAGHGIAVTEHRAFDEKYGAKCWAQLLLSST